MARWSKKSREELTAALLLLLLLVKTHARCQMQREAKKNKKPPEQSDFLARQPCYRHTPVASLPRKVQFFRHRFSALHNVRTTCRRTTTFHFLFCSLHRFLSSPFIVRFSLWSRMSEWTVRRRISFLHEYVCVWMCLCMCVCESYVMELIVYRLAGLREEWSAAGEWREATRTFLHHQPFSHLFVPLCSLLISGMRTIALILTRRSGCRLALVTSSLIAGVSDEPRCFSLSFFSSFLSIASLTCFAQNSKKKKRMVLKSQNLLVSV